MPIQDWTRVDAAIFHDFHIAWIAELQQALNTGILPENYASYVADKPVEVYLEHLALGATLPDMPLFIDPERYVGTPLESTYAAAYRGMPAFWRDVLEGRSRG
jgi:hypothetical protein